MTRLNLRPACKVQKDPKYVPNMRNKIVGYETEYDEFKAWKESIASKAVDKHREKFANFLMSLLMFFIFSHLLMLVEYFVIWKKLFP